MPLDAVIADLPLRLGGGAAVGAAPSDVDVLIDRIPFWLSIRPDTPYQRETAPYQREQIDQQPEAGEQSLAGWWTRSQMSFHYGAGLDYLDTTARPLPEDRLRFKTSRNVNVWTPGKVARLNGTDLVRSAGLTDRVWVEAIDGGLAVSTSTKVETWNGTTWTTLATPASSIRAFTVDGANYWYATIAGVYKGSLAGGAAALVFNLPSTDVPMCLGWVKQRLMLGHGAAVYSLDTAGPALPTAKLTHPVSGWTWSAFSDGPNGILACGYAGLTSGVYAFSLTDVSGTPTLGAGVPLLSLPQGERVLSSLYYLGSLLVLGTTRGVRVCPFETFQGSITLGPLSVESETSVTALGGYDRYVWAGTRVAGETSLVRVDLGAPLDDAGHYAWAPDLVFPTGTWTDAVTAISFQSNGRLAIGVQGRGTVFEDTVSDPSDSAWLQTARIRMGTVEDKHWLYGVLRGSYSNEAQIGVSVQATGDTTRFDSVHVTTDNTDRFALHARSGEWVALRFDFAAEAELNSYQVQALPGGARQRLVSLPLALSDFQLTRSGVEVGFAGWALERLAALEALEASGLEITVSAPTLFPEGLRGAIEKVSYVQAHDPGDQGSGTGGVLQVVLRTTS